MAPKCAQNVGKGGDEPMELNPMIAQGEWTKVEKLNAKILELKNQSESVLSRN